MKYLKIAGAALVLLIAVGGAIWGALAMFDGRYAMAEQVQKEMLRMEVRQEQQGVKLDLAIVSAQIKDFELAKWRIEDRTGTTDPLKMNHDERQRYRNILKALRDLYKQQDVLLAKQAKQQNPVASVTVEPAAPGGGGP